MCQITSMKQFFLALFFVVSAALTSFAQISPIRMDVLQKQKTESKGAGKASKTQIRSLEISLQNLSRQEHPNLQVHYWFFAKGIKDGDIDVFKKGERKASLAAGEKQVIESEQVNSSYTEDHVQVEKGKAKGNHAKSNPAATVRKVEGSGDRIVGYGVRLMDGDKVLAEVFSPQGLKDKVK